MGADARRLGLAILALGSATLAGCDTTRLVDLKNPDAIGGAVVRDPANIAEVRNGAFFEFARALTGPPANNSTPGIIGLSGLLTDEAWFSSTFTGMQDIDRRSVNINNANLLLSYQYLHRARNAADRAAEQYAASATLKDSPDHATLVNIAGFVHVLFAETFCSGVPVSTTDFSGTLTFGAPLSTAQTLDSAVAHFDRALASATSTGSSAQQNLARVGRARALLARGDLTGAASAAASVPTAFRHEVEYSENSSSQGNGVFYNINAEKRTSVASGEGINGVVFFMRGPKPNTIDSRVSADSLGRGIGTQLPLYQQNKYSSLGSPVILASGIEARLIEAEAALAKGQSAAYLPIVNGLRASAGLPALTDPGVGEPRIRQFFQERAFSLWLTAHRLGDLRRMIRLYGLGAETVFPTGQTISRSPYGTDVNFPIPFQERNNPQFANGQCIDRAA